jgi:hypothetical protein
MKNNMYFITFFFMRLISFTYRDGRVASNEATGTLDGMGANAPTVMDENSSTGTPGIHITPGTLAPCRPINIYLLDKSLQNRVKFCQRTMCYTPPSSHSCRGDNSFCLKDVPKNSLCLLAKQKERKHG